MVVAKDMKMPGVWVLFCIDGDGEDDACCLPVTDGETFVFLMGPCTPEEGVVRRRVRSVAVARGVGVYHDSIQRNASRVSDRRVECDCPVEVVDGCAPPLEVLTEAGVVTGGAMVSIMWLVVVVVDRTGSIQCP
jgi:hypothetical protein